MLKRFAALFSDNTAKENHSEPEAVHLATCAILLEAAHIDDEFTEDERLHILGVIQERFSLTEDDAHELIETAAHARDKGTGLYRFTREINQSCSVSEKLRFVEEIWRIFYSDGVLGGHEDHLARKLGKLLNLNHPQLIETKMRIKEEQR